MSAIFSSILNHKKLLLVFVLLMTGVGGYFYFNQGNGEELKFQTVQIADIKSTTSASGILTGKTTVNLKFKISGRLAYIEATRGAIVTKGETIAGLDTQDLNIALQQARNNLRDAQATVDKVYDDLKDEDDSEDETYEERQTRTSAEVAKDNAYDSVKAAQRAFQDAVIYSPIQGIVTQVSGEPGQIVSPTDTIAQVVDNSEIFFDTELDEADLGRISLNQPAIITLDAFPDQEFSGIISEILPSTKLNSSNATVVPIRISIPSFAFPFVQGLNGQATIILKEVKNALVIPQEALLTDNSVLVKTSTGVVEKQIQTGISSDTDIEVISGLNEGDQVVTNPSVYERSQN